MMDGRAERPRARVWSPRPSPGQLRMSQEGPDWSTERERKTENLEPGSCPVDDLISAIKGQGGGVSESHQLGC